MPLDAAFIALDALAKVGLDLRKSLSSTWMGIAMWQYLLAFLMVLGPLSRKMATSLLERLVLPSLERFGGRLAGRIVGAMIQPLTALIGLIGLYLAVNILLFPTGPTHGDHDDTRRSDL